MSKQIKTKILYALLIILILLLTYFLAIWTIVWCEDCFDKYGFNIGTIFGILEFWIVGILLFLPSMLKCPKCRTKCKITQQFCTNCGEKINKIETIKNNFQKKHFIIIMFGILLSVLCYMIMLGIFNSTTIYYQETSQSETTSSNYDINIPQSLKDNYIECQEYCIKATENARGNGEYTACFEERLNNKSESDYKIYTKVYDMCNESTTNECDKGNCIKEYILK